MRPFLASLLALFLIGGTAAYTQFASQIRRPPTQRVRTEAEGKFEIAIERTFDAVADPLAELAAIEVLFAGQTLYRSESATARNTPIRFAIDGFVETGSNELLVTANRDFLDTDLAAIVVTLYRDNIPLGRKTITSQPGLATVSGTLTFEATGTTSHVH